MNQHKLSQINQKILSLETLRLREMEEITEKDYRKFLKSHAFVIVENVKIPLPKEHKIKRFEPENFKLETTTVWSFPDRGDWATHRGDYRAN